MERSARLATDSTLADAGGPARGRCRATLTGSSILGQRAWRANTADAEVKDAAERDLDQAKEGSCSPGQVARLTGAGKVGQAVSIEADPQRHDKQERPAAREAVVRREPASACRFSRLEARELPAQKASTRSSPRVLR